MRPPVLFLFADVASRGRLLSIIVLLLSVVVWLSRQSILLCSARFLVASEGAHAADLILVLGGDFFGPRVLKAAELGFQGYAPVVLISGPPYQGRPEGEFAVDFLAKNGYPRSLFSVFGHSAHSTVDEAIVVCPELRRRRAWRVLLVTSSYHSRRALIVFRLFCPSVEFTSIPAPDSHYDPEHWQTDASSNSLFQSEWRKIFGTIFISYPESFFADSRNLQE